MGRRHDDGPRVHGLGGWEAIRRRVVREPVQRPGGSHVQGRPALRGRVQTRQDARSRRYVQAWLARSLFLRGSCVVGQRAGIWFGSVANAAPDRSCDVRDCRQCTCGPRVHDTRASTKKTRRMDEGCRLGRAARGETLLSLPALAARGAACLGVLLSTQKLRA